MRIEESKVHKVGLEPFTENHKGVKMLYEVYWKL